MHADSQKCWKRVSCDEKEMWIVDKGKCGLKLEDKCVGTILLCIKILTMEVYKLGPFSGFAFEQGYSKC